MDVLVSKEVKVIFIGLAGTVLVLLPIVYRKRIHFSSIFGNWSIITEPYISVVTSRHAFFNGNIMPHSEVDPHYSCL